MASGDRIYLADKETLDSVNSKIGGIMDTGSATSGSIFGKINALFSGIASLADNWTAVRAAKIDDINAKTGMISSMVQDVSTAASSANTAAASASSNTATNNTPSSVGFLSQKLSYIIQQLGGLGQKKLVSKQISFQISATGAHTILDVTGGGQFEYARTTLPYGNNTLWIECDGAIYEFTGKSGTCIVGRFMNYPTEQLSCVTSDTFNNINYLLHQPLHFKDRLRIYVQKKSPADESFHALYSVYE